MKNNRIYIPILLILLRFRYGITANELKTEGPKYVSYDMWLGLCDKIVATAEEAYKKVSMDKNMVGRTKNIKAIEGAFKNFEVIVGKVKEHCRQMKQLQHLPKYLPMDDGYSLRLDIASRGHGRVVVASVLAFHRYYNEFIVVSKIEKEDIDYLGALNFLESNIIETTSCSSFSYRVNFSMLIPIVFMIPYISL